MNAPTAWRFDPDEFIWVWEVETDSDVLPFPICIVETTSTGTEFAQLRAHLSDRHPRNGDSRLTTALRILADPELRVVSWGRLHNSDFRIRTLAAAADDVGVVLHQQSGATADFGGGLEVVVTQRTQLGRRIAAALPSAPPGAAGKLVGYTPRVRGESPPSSWLRGDNGKRPVEERIRRLLRQPRYAEGYIRIEQNLYNPRSYPPHYLSWFDIRHNAPGGGRYLVDVSNDDTTLIPAAADFIAHEIDRRTVKQHLYDE